MSKQSHQAISFLSGISLNSKHNSTSKGKSKLRESQASFPIPVSGKNIKEKEKTSVPPLPSPKHLRSNTEATSFLTSISLKKGTTPRKDKNDESTTTLNKSNSSISNNELKSSKLTTPRKKQRADIKSTKSVLKTFSKNPEKTRIVFSTKTEQQTMTMNTPFYCFSMIKYQSTDSLSIKRKKGESKGEITNISHYNVFHNVDIKPVSYEQLLNPTWVKSVEHDTINLNYFNSSHNDDLLFGSDSDFNSNNNNNNNNNSNNNNSGNVSQSNSKEQKEKEEEKEEEENKKKEEEYDPDYIDDPDLKTGKHRTVLNLPGFRASIIPFINANDLKEELNEQFRQKHSWIDPQLGITLHKIRKFKRKLLDVAIDQDLEPSTIALSYVFLEKLMLKNIIHKENLNLIGSTCLLLAIKFNDKKIFGTQVKDMIEAFQKYIDVDSKLILSHEFDVFAKLSFSLFVDPQEAIPHYTRLLTQMEPMQSQEENYN